MMRLFLLFSAAATLVTGFQIQPKRLESLYRPAAASKTLLWQSKSCENEWTRRDALLASTAAASLTVTTSLPAAAAAVKVDIAKAIKDIELKYADSVNTNGAPEKHLPEMAMYDGSVEAVVNHVMDPDKPHYIEYMWIKDMKTGRILASRQFQPTDPSPPSITASNVKDGSLVKAFLFCNLHGLWQGEAMTV